MDKNNGEFSYDGQRSCLFEHDNVEEAEKAMDFETIKEYGDKFLNEDGSVKHYLHTWDDGERELLRCKKCGAFFIRQDSEYHSFDDSYYTDWFQVESPAMAEKLNEVYNGWQLEQEYHAPSILRTNERYHWNKKE
ncbi:MAG: hypothetical protein EOM11_06315 [Erysipelotrichia bacterium]|nr:hypothetical protein [Lachnospiraceae bacterium]NCC55083.1 hypothetical protein [Erysipelotrichia bacterium]